MSEIVKDEPATHAPPWFSPWPATDLCTVGTCPVCGNAHRTTLYEGLVDNVFYCAPGKWTSWRCSGCHSAYLDPCPSPTSIYLAYRAYYTHRVVQKQKSDYAALSPLRKLRRRLVNGYTNWRYSTRENPASPVGVIVLLAAWPVRIILDQEYRHLPRLPKGGGALLDLGCGNGSFLGIAQASGWDAIGADFDPGAVASCQGRGFKVLVGGIEQFESQERIFDVITLSHVLEHFHDPTRVLRACHRLLKPGGQLWLETPNIESLSHRRYGKNWRGLEPPRHLVLFTEQSLIKALNLAGLNCVQRVSRPSPLVWMTKANEAIRQGLPNEADIKLSLAQRLGVWADRLREVLDPRLKEFLTVIGTKDL